MTRKSLLKSLVPLNGVEYYHVDYVALRKAFSGGTGDVVTTPIPYEGLPPVAVDFDAAGLRAAIIDSQRHHGQYYRDFTQRAMQAGVQGYIAFLRGQRVTYWGRGGDQHTEWFPGAGPTSSNDRKLCAQTSLAALKQSRMNSLYSEGVVSLWHHRVLGSAWALLGLACIVDVHRAYWREEGPLWLPLVAGAPYLIASVGFAMVRTWARILMGFLVVIAVLIFAYLIFMAGWVGNRGLLRWMEIALGFALYTGLFIVLSEVDRWETRT